MRKLGLVLVALVAAMAAPSSAAGASTCATLQDDMDSAPAGGTVVLGAAGGLCEGFYNLPQQGITLVGEDGAGFTGEGIDDRSLTGRGVGTTTLRNLVFTGPDDGGFDAGGLEITGDSTVTIDDCVFTGLSWTDSGGGALISVFQSEGATPTRVLNSTFGTATGGNVATESGGGLAVFTDDTVTLENNVFRGNRAGISGGGARISALDAFIRDNEFDANEAGQAGGGLALTVEGLVLERAANGVDAALERNRFHDNVAGAAAPQPTRDVPFNSATSEEGYGGGLFVGKVGDQIDGVFESAQARFVGPPAAGGAPPVVDLADNVYDENAVDDSDNSREGRGGGGAMLYGVRATSSAERYTRNTLPGWSNFCECENEGGGLSVKGATSSREATFDAVNLVVAGNSVGDGAEGGGIYIGSDEGGTAMSLDHATVAGNAIGRSGRGAGIAADFNDTVDLLRSIVFGNTEEAPQNDRATFEEISGGTVTARYSDVCEEPLSAGRADANGNICEDPKLVGPTAAQGADVHQTAASPTIDGGPSQESNPTVDYEGDARPTVASSRTGTPYDMGADEFISADYKVAISDSPDPVTQGDQVTYTVTVTNSGPASVSGLSASVTLPAGATLVSAARAARACSSGSQGCDVGTLAAGQSRAVTVVARLNNLGANTATATVSGPDVDPTAGDHTATTSTQVNARPAASGGLLPATAAPCSGRRRFTIHVRKLRDPVVSAVIRVNGKRVPVRKRNGRLTAVVDLRKLPKMRAVVTIKAVTKAGRKLSGRRVYHPCTAGRPGGIPNL